MDERGSDPRFGGPRWGRFLPNLRGTGRATLAPDLAAGATVAILAIPQGMAYALLAGVPPEMGLFAAAVPAAVAALFGSSSHLVTGPTNPTALIVGTSVVAPALAAGRGAPLDAVLGTALLAGLVLAGLGLLGLGRASRFFSDSVIAGFALGAGSLIALSQVPALLGVSSVGGDTGPGLLPLVLRAGRALSRVEPRAALLGVATVLVIPGLRRIDPRLPGPLVALGAATLASHLAGWHTGPQAIPRVAGIARSLPSLSLPGLADPASLVGPASAVALVAILQSIGAARTIAARTGEPLDASRELFAQGLANLSAAFCGALPANGSLTRSALNHAVGARSRLAALSSGLWVALALPLLAPILEAIPLAALAGVVVHSGLDLINPRALRRAASTRGDALVLLGTVGAVFALDLVQAIYLGVLLSLGLLVWRAGHLHVVEVVQTSSGRLREIPVDRRTGTTPAVVLHLEGDLYFAVAQDLGDRLAEIGARGPRVVILRLKRARHLDATVLDTLARAARDYRERGIELLLCGLSDSMVALLRRTELARVVGEQALLPAGARLFEGLERALDRARQRLQPLRDEEIFRSEEPPGRIDEIRG